MALDAIDVTLLQLVAAGASIQEMCERVMLSSTNTVHNRLRRLEREGYINPPPRRKQARSRTLTAIGERYASNYLDPKVGR